jgi:IS30 family transposase
MRALSDADRERVTELAEEGLSAKRIGAMLGKHPSTVQWCLYSTGLRAPSYGSTPGGSYTRRDGRVVHRFTPDEDRYIEQLRVRGLGLREIAALASARFGTQRTHHTIRCRLVMRAASEEAIA